MKYFLINILIIFTFCCCNVKNNNSNVSESKNINSDSLNSDNTPNPRLQNYYLTHLEEVIKKKPLGNIPEKGIILDSLSAINVAQIVLTNIYGAKTIKEEKPFTALSNTNYWIIFGHLPDGYVGGVAEIIIKKRNGEIIHIMHGK